ncbi:hypothetical protein K469DRAFT_692329 [Zopfia rhizophila CBS 207.26]|uniref:Uncharacterized protein n=1 Tax=Zopfia rhizophila CBS 207.26 TaxID=1314779 RepID=A0A6A6DNM4_9PEZI|nr:hypothetical protein K469DRAFT_692329 [Zopfia rhizophila CBS 207.26]
MRFHSRVRSYDISTFGESQRPPTSNWRESSSAPHSFHSTPLKGLSAGLKAVSSSQTTAITKAQRRGVDLEFQGLWLSLTPDRFGNGLPPEGNGDAARTTHSSGAADQVLKRTDDLLTYEGAPNPFVCVEILDEFETGDPLI